MLIKRAPSIPSLDLYQRIKDKPLSIEIENHPVSVNMIWRRKASGGMYKVAKANAWGARAEITIRLGARLLWSTYNLASLIGHPISLELLFYRDTWHGKTKNKRDLYVRPDLSNFIKATEDAVMSALFLDDCAIINLQCKKVERAGGDAVGIRLQFL